MSVRIFNYQDNQKLYAYINSQRDLLVVAPTRKKAGFLRDELDPLAGNKVFTLSELGHWLYRRGGGTAQLVTPLQRAYILRKILEQNKDKTEALSRAQVSEGLVQSLLQFFSTVHQEGVKLREASVDARLYPDLELVHRAYRTYMNAGKLIDNEMMIETVLTLIPDLEPLGKHLLIDTLQYRTPLDRHFLSTLAGKVTGVTVANDLAGLALERQGADLEKLWQAWSEIDFPGRLQQVLSDRSYDYYTFFNSREEVQAVAGRIKELLVAGVKPEQIMVIPADMPAYLPLVRESFEAYGVPLDVWRGLPLFTTTPAALLQTILDLITDPYNRVFWQRLFSSRLVQYDGLDFSVIDRLARYYNINDLEPLLDESLVPETTLTRELGTENLDAMKRFARRLACFKEDTTVASYCAGLKGLLSDLNIVEKVLATDQGGTSLKRELMVALARIFEVFDEVKKAVELAVGCQHKVKTEALGSLVKAALKDKEYYLPDYAGGVVLTDFLNLRGMQGGHIFFLGMVETYFPPKQTPSFLLAQHLIFDARREASLYLYRLLKGPGCVTISGPRLARGRETKPAPLLAGFVAKDWSCRKRLLAQEEVCRELAITMERSFWRRYARPQDYKALYMEITRETQKKPHRFAGSVPSGFYPREGVFSVSMLEDYNRCPMLFFFRRMLALAPELQITEELEGAEVGAQIHQVLECFGKDGGFELLRQDKEKATELIESIARQTLAGAGIEMKDNLFLQRQYEKWVQGLTDNETPGVLVRFLDREADRLSYLEPKAFEVVFGMEGNPPLCIGTHRLRGRIDRIDKVKDGGFIIYDYKTGVCPRRKEIITKKSLQLPLYLLALATNPVYSREPTIAVYYQLDPRQPINCSTPVGGGHKRLVPGKRRIDLEDLGGLAAYQGLIEQITAGLRRGRFGTTTWTEDEAHCRYCDYRLICRHQAGGDFGNGEGMEVDDDCS